MLHVGTTLCVKSNPESDSMVLISLHQVKNLVLIVLILMHLDVLTL